MMSPKKHLRSTPGPDADPSDAFLDALSERAAKDSAENLSNGGRVAESVFDDPTVRQALGVPLPDVPVDRYKDLRAAIIAKNDALLRQQNMNDNAYWLQANKAQRRVILKHQFSCAQDAHVAIEVASDKKVIYIDVEHDPGRVPVTQIAQLVVHGGLDIGGEEPFNDDTADGSVESFSRRTPWRIVVRSGDALFHLTITKQYENNWDYNLQLVPKVQP